MVLWVPSQKGLLAEWPQRHREMEVFPPRSHSVPLQSTSLKGPSTLREPLRRTVILTSLSGTGCSVVRYVLSVFECSRGIKPSNVQVPGSGFCTEAKISQVAGLNYF